MITVYFRTFIIYAVLIFAMRLMGKRQVGELEVSELTVTIMLSELAAIPITDRDIPLAYGIVPVLLLLAAEVMISHALIRFPIIKKLLAGKPSILIRDGKLDQKELYRQRFGLSELLSSLRQCGIGSISDVSYAILEENGKISAFPKTADAPATPKQLSVEVSEEGIDHALIIDRRIIPENLSLSGWSEKRLVAELSQRKLELSQIFLFSVTDGGDITVIVKEKRK